MAAMVASQHHHHHHQGMWEPQRRTTTQLMGLPLQMNNMVHNQGANSSASRSYQHSPSDMQQMPIYPPTSVAGQLSFQPSYGFDMQAMNHYSIPQQHFNVNFQSVPVAAQSSYTSSPNEMSAPASLVRESRNSVPISRTPPLKSEAPSPIQVSPNHRDRVTRHSSHSAPSDSGDGSTVTFSTEIDCLMRTIQAKQPMPEKAATRTPTSRPQRSVPEHVAMTEADTKVKSRKRYLCSEPGCNKTFFQKTHLEIHTRAHTGYKPFVCKEPSCGQRFSQLGNLKTHERRHTGERPFQCDICGKTFAQRGNVRAHRIVHENKKPFTCKLDDCGKQFTQLGNLKSHQNKFHAQTVRYLTQKFATYREGDTVTKQDKDTWEYFADLYKNSNRGIKGRGKDRRISTVASPASSTSFTSSSSYPALVAPTMSRNATNGSMHTPAADRSSRSSSYASAQTHAHVDIQHHAVRPIHHEIHQPYSQQYVDHQHYNSMVFPERKYV